jgi:hypothetical protein
MINPNMISPQVDLGVENHKQQNRNQAMDDEVHVGQVHLAEVRVGQVHLADVRVGQVHLEEVCVVRYT